MSYSPSLFSKKPISSWKEDLLISLMLLLLSVVLRLPFFFPDVIHWDESTFILMGQSILDGHLPYTKLWDIKPPLAFLAYALFIFCLGKSIVAIRLAGAICIAITGWLTYRIGKTIWSYQLGVLAGVLLVIIASVIDYSLPVMTEHVALVPLMAALCLLISRKPNSLTFFIVGALLATATLIRLNLAYVSLIMGLLIVFQQPIYSIGYFLKRGIAYAGGNLLVIFLTFIPYIIAEEQHTWWTSVVSASWVYATSQPAQSNADKLAIDLLSLLLLIGGFLGIKLLTKKWRKILTHQQTPLFIWVMFFIATEISILRSGAAADHYTIQLFPCFALLVALLLNACLPSKARLNLVITVLTILAIILSPILPQYRTMITRAVEGKSLTYGSSYAIASYLKQANPNREPVYLTIDHLAYWLMDMQPLSKSTTHPSNIKRDYLFEVMGSDSTSSEMEMAHLLTQKPKFIVQQHVLWYLDKKPQAAAVLKDVLDQQYKLVKKIEDRQIYRRISLD